MLKVTIKKWGAAEDAYKAGNYAEAIGKFSSAQETSKLQYNLGQCYIAVQDFASANAAFSKSIQLDGYMCIAYAARATTWVYLGRMQEAIDDFKLAIETLRGHEHIDYGQLGLDYRLLRSDILYDQAVVFTAMGGARMREAKKCADEAAKCAQQREETKPRIAALKRAIDGGNQPSEQIVLIDSGLFKAPRIEKGPDEGFKPAAMTGIVENKVAMPSPLSKLSFDATGRASASDQYGGGGGGGMPNPALANKPMPAPGGRGALPMPGGGGGRGRGALPTPGARGGLPAPGSRAAGLPAPGAAGAMKRFKVFYKDRRLVQIPQKNASLKALREAIETKFALSLNGMLIKFATTDAQPFICTIVNDKDLQVCLRLNCDSLYINRDNEVNTFEPKTIWTEYFSEEGERYYHNQNNNETSWGPFDPDESAAAAGGGWEECFTDDGQKYYYNTASGETAWEKP